MVNPDERPLVIAVLGLGEAGSVIARDLVAAGAIVRGYDPAVAAGPGITDAPGEAEAARGADLVLSVNSAKAAVDAFRAGRPGLRAAMVEALEAARAAGHERWLREHIAAELTEADAGSVERIVDGTARHAVRRTAEMQAAAEMLTELGVPPLMADASRALHERLSATHHP